MIPFIRKQLAPNRLAVYLTAAAALATALVTVLGDLDFQSTAGALGSISVLAVVAAKWLAGWQQYESALYESQLIEAKRVAVLEQQAAALEAQQAVGRAGSKRAPILPR